MSDVSGTPHQGAGRAYKTTSNPFFGHFLIPGVVLCQLFFGGGYSPNRVVPPPIWLMGGGGQLSPLWGGLILWFRLLWFAVLCHLLLWWHKTTLGWFYHPERGGFIPQKGWLYPPKRVVLSPLKVGIKPPGVVLRVVLSPIWGWFYSQDQRRCSLMERDDLAEPKL